MKYQRLIVYSIVGVVDCVMGEYGGWIVWADVLRLALLSDSPLEQMSRKFMLLDVPGLVVLSQTTFFWVVALLWV